MTLQIAGKCGDSDRDAEICQPFRQLHDADLPCGQGAGFKPAKSATERCQIPHGFHAKRP